MAPSQSPSAANNNWQDAAASDDAGEAYGYGAGAELVEAEPVEGFEIEIAEAVVIGPAPDSSSRSSRIANRLADARSTKDA